MRNTTRVGPGEPQGTFGTRGGALAEQVPGAPDAQSPLERAEQEPRISYRNEGALGRVKLCRVTAVEWSRSWRAPQNRSNRAPRKGTRLVSARIATEASEARSVSRMGRTNTPPQCEIDPPKRFRSVVKRSNLRSRWAASHRAHAQPLQHEAIVREAADWGRWAGKRQGTGAR